MIIDRQDTEDQQALPVHLNAMPQNKRGRPQALAHRIHLVALGLAALLAFLVGYTHLTIPARLSISQQCRMSRMYPSYVLHHPNSPSGLDKKYSLYLYRENEPTNLPPWVDPPKPRRSRPAIFVPGNAGSYGQIRSVASWSHRHYKERSSDDDPTRAVWNTDWWTLDFNEDFSAFHAPTLEAQAIYLNEVISYLVAYYQEDGLDSIPILAHSMGGIVARLALGLPNHHESKPIKTMLTLSTPHAVPPAPLEEGMDRIYSRIEAERLSDATASKVLFVSLSGGLLDTQLPSDYAVFPNSTGLQPVIQGYTTDIASLWSSVDHLAMMWCDQLRRRVSWLVDEEVHRGQRETLPLKKIRWEKGLKLGSRYRSQNSGSQLSEWLEDAPIIIIPREQATKVFPVPGSNNMSQHVFQFITSLPLGTDPTLNAGSSGQERQLHIFVCRSQKEFPRGEKSDCKPLPPWAFDILPPSPSSSSSNYEWSSFPHAETHYEEAGNAQRFLSLTSQALSDAGGWTSIQVVQTKGADDEWRARWISISGEPQNSAVGPSGAVLRGIRIASRSSLNFNLTASLPGQITPILRRFRLPQISSSLFAYTFTLSSDCGAVEPGAPGKHTTAPMLHVFSPATGDGRWYPSLSTFKGGKEFNPMPVHIHSTSPFINAPPPSLQGVTIEIVSEPRSCAGPDTLAVHIDWRSSFGLWLARYRWGILAWTFAHFGLFGASLLASYTKAEGRPVNRQQPMVRLSQPQEKVLPPFEDLAALLTTRWVSPRGALPALLIGILALAILKRFVIVGFGAEEHLPAARDSLFGLVGEGAIAWGLASSDLGLSVLLGVGLLAMSWGLLTVLVYGVNALTFGMAWVLSVVFKSRAKYWFAFGAPRKDLGQLQWRKGTLLVLFGLMVAIKMVVPYQLILTAVTAMQIVNAVRSQISCWTATEDLDGALTRKQLNNFVLLHLTLLLPLKIPTLLVFARNFLAGYLSASPPGGADFGEDHSLWRIMPWLATVQILSSGQVLQVQIPLGQQRVSVLLRRLWIRLTVVPIHLLLAVYAIVWGIRHPYRLYDLSTVGIICILVAHYATRWQQAKDSVRKARDSSPSFDHRPKVLRGDNSESIPLTSRDDVVPYSLPEEFTTVAQELDSTSSISELPVDVQASPERLASNATVAPAATTEESAASHTPPITAEQASSPTMPSSGSAAELDALLVRYLNLLDRYSALRASSSKHFSDGFFSLSAAQMGSLAGWGKGSTGQQRKRLFLLTEGGSQLPPDEGGRRRELGVECRSEAPLAGKTQADSTKWTLEVLEPEIKELPSDLSDDSENVIVEEDLTKAGAGDTKNIQTSGIRQRRRGAADSNEQNLSVDTDTDEKHKGHNSPALRGVADVDTTEVKGVKEALAKVAALPPTALERFHPLPPAQLRRAKGCFLEALGNIVTGSTAKQPESQEAVQDSPSFGVGLAGIVIEQQLLERRIRALRQELAAADQHTIA